MILFIKYNNN